MGSGLLERRAALGSLNPVLRTRVQLARCARVSFCLFWDTGAVGVLREGLILLMVRLCSKNIDFGVNYGNKKYRFWGRLR